MKKATFNKIADGIHRGFVWSCIGLTLCSFGFLGYRGYIYVVYERPVMQEINAKYQEALLKEGERLKNASKEQLPA